MADVSRDMLISIEANTYALCQGLDAVIGRLDKFDKGVQEVGKSTSFVNNTLSVFAGNLGVKIVGAATKAFAVLKEGFDRFVDLAKGATLESARIEVQWRVLSGTAARMGVTFEDVQKAVGNLRAAGIKTSEALQVMTQWLSAGLPSDKLSELSRAAQDLAVVLGSDSTQAMERFNWFVQTGNSELLRTVGIMQTSTQMEEKFAQGIGKTREQLSDQERRLARVNGLLEATAAYAGSYEEALRDPFKRLTSLPRLISNVTEAIGAVFVPLLGAGVDIVSDLLEKIERLFRVTKKESKETGKAIGTWKDGFLKLRAVVTAFSNWFMSIWKRVTGSFNESTESMMDRFVRIIVNGVKAAANALRKFATFVAGIFGGRAPGEITTEAVARTKPEAKPEAPRPTPPVAEPTQVMAAPQEAAKLRAKPVAAPAAEDIARYAELGRKWAAATAKVADASAKAAKAREAMARAEEWLERASERVYDIRCKIQRLELDWAEIPERFIRGRKRQLQIEQMAAEDEEHERKKVVDAERERLKLAEEYERQVTSAADKIKSELDKVGDSISKQAEKYGEWVDKLAEAEEIQLVEPIQAVVNEFESLDDLTAGYLEEIEGELMPAFASIEESVRAIGDNLGIAWEKVKGIATDIKQWFSDLPPWAKKLFETGALVLGLNFVTGGMVGTALKGVLGAAFAAIGLNPAAWAIVGAGISISLLLIPALDPAVRQKWKDAWGEFTGGGNVGQAIGKATGATLEKIPFVGNFLKSWADEFRAAHPELIETAREGVAVPIINAAQEAYDALFGNSIIPDLVANFETWFGQLPLITNPILDDLTTKLELLDNLAKGLLPSLESLRIASGGKFEILQVNITGNTFGSNVEEREVRDWIFESVQQAVT